MECPKCHGVMVDDSSMGVHALRCMSCGNRHYPGYPKRPGTIEICHTCGEEFEKKRANGILCDVCSESDRYVLSNRKQIAKHKELKHDSAMQ